MYHHQYKSFSQASDNIVFSHAYVQLRQRHHLVSVFWSSTILPCGIATSESKTGLTAIILVTRNAKKIKIWKHLGFESVSLNQSLKSASRFGASFRCLGKAVSSCLLKQCWTSWIKHIMYNSVQKQCRTVDCCQYSQSFKVNSPYNLGPEAEVSEKFLSS